MHTATPTLSPELIADIRAPLTQANEYFLGVHPGDVHSRQPVHTVYGGAQLFKAQTALKIGELALRSLEQFAPDASALGNALGWFERNEGDAVAPTSNQGWRALPYHHSRMNQTIAQTVYARVVDKLQREAVEDFRVDFEDGFGHRPDNEEDAEAVRCAQEVVAGMTAGQLPPFIGIRIKPLSEELAARSLRTLDLFLSEVLRSTDGELPNNFVVTVPKVVIADHVTAVSRALDAIESAFDLAPGSILIELMIETPQSIIDTDGRSNLPALVRAANGRCRGAHFGTYDYTALCNITAEWQHMTHPACDFARHMMQVALAQRGLMLSDGATNVMPVGPHRAAPGTELTAVQVEENARVVHRAWRLGYEHVRHSLEHAYFQGWDLHPAQLPIRYAAVFAFFLEGRAAATERLTAFMEKAAQATLVGDVFDDAATGQGLLNFFLRGMSCGAITQEEALATGLTVAEFQTRSFGAILDQRRSLV